MSQTIHSGIQAGSISVTMDTVGGLATASAGPFGALWNISANLTGAIADTHSRRQHADRFELTTGALPSDALPGSEVVWGWLLPGDNDTLLAESELQTTVGSIPQGGDPTSGPLVRQWLYLALAIVPLWILTGNILVLLSVVFYRNLRTLSNLVIASLAVTDFLLAILVVPMGVYQLVNGTWDLGLTVCLIWSGSDVFLSTTSILHLCAIAIHRFLGIAYPLRIRSTQDKRHVMALLIPAWTVSFAISLPLIVQGSLDSNHVLVEMADGRGRLCGIFDQTFAIYSSLVSFFIPLTIMVFADTRSVQILRNNIKIPMLSYGRRGDNNKLRSQCSADSASLYDLAAENSLTTPPMDTPVATGNRITDSQDFATRMSTTFSDQELCDYSNANNSTPVTPQTDVAPGFRRGNISRRRRSVGYISILAARGMKVNSRERRAEKTLIWVFVCFVVLWLPFFCTNLTYGLCRVCDIPDYLFTTFTWLGYVSSGVNPCLYTFLNKDFRTAFKRILKCGCTKLDMRKH